MLAPLGRRRAPAYPLFLVLSGWESAAFAAVFTANLVFQAVVVGLSPVELVLVGTVLELTCLLAEIPTGVLADAVSRRRSVVVGTLLTGLGFVVEALSHDLAGVLVAQVVWGIGATFVSGARDAWLAGEVGPEAAAGAYVRAAQVGSLAGLAGTGLAVALAQVSVRSAVLAGGVLLIALGLVLAVAMPERERQRRNDSGPGGGAGRRWPSLTAPAREAARAVRAAPALGVALTVAVALGAATEGYDRLWTPHVVALLGAGAPGGPVAWIGLLGVASTVVGVPALEWLRRRAGACTVRTLAWTYAGTAAGVAVLALAPSAPVALAAVLVVGVLRGLAGPVWTSWVVGHTPEAVRATVLSAVAQADALGQVGGGPGVGLAAQRSLRLGLGCSAGLLVAPVLLLAWARAGERRRDAMLAA